MDDLLKTKKEFKNLKKQEIEDTFTEMSWIRFVFNMTWLMKILKIYRKEQLQIKNSKYDGCQKGLDSMVYKFFD